jgi:hypothetical protein
MKKPAIFIDAFISSEEKKKWFDYNLAKFIKQGHDVFIISNKMPSFDKFENVKYFEYDSTNRLLTDGSKYTLTSRMRWEYQLYDGLGNSYFLEGYNTPHGFTNWTILYNLKKICKILKNNGYEYMMRCEYDVVFKNYDLMSTIFKDFGVNEKNKTCMILPGGFGCITNFFLINVNYLDAKIPELENEDDYMKFMHTLYGCNASPVFEQLLYSIIKDDCEYLDEKSTFEFIEHLGVCLSDGDMGFRHNIVYGNILMIPINDNTEFFIYNVHNTSPDGKTYIEYTTENSSGQLSNTLFLLLPGRWIRCPCSKFVEIKTSQMKSDKSVRFDLSKPCTFTIVKN